MNSETISFIVSGVLSRLSDHYFPVSKSVLENEIKKMIVSQISDKEELTELQKQILIESIIKRFHDAVIKNHDPVGVNAALTIGENMTQSSLQSHHHAGLKKGAAGFDRIEEITNMSNKNNIVKVITTPNVIQIGNKTHEIPRSKFEVNEIANMIINIVLNDIIERYEIMEGEVPKWYEISKRFKGIAFNPKPKWIRIYLYKNLLYKYRITLRDVEYSLQQVVHTNGETFVPPIGLGETYVDIHTSEDISDAEIYKQMSKYLSATISGIESVELAYPIPENLLTNLRVSKIGDGQYSVTSSAPSFVPPFVWKQMIKAFIPDAKFVTNTGKEFTSDYSLSDVRKMILSCPMIYADVLKTQEKLRGEDGNDYYRLTFREELVDEFPYLEHADLLPHEFDTEEEVNNFLLDVMVDYHYFWYIEAICSKVQDLYVMSEIDSTRTYTTSPLDCQDALGYMAMRSMIFTEFKQNSGVNPIHLKVIVNNITLYKNPVSIRRNSIRNDKSEWMTYTTFEDVLKHLSYAAFVGDEDHMKSVSSQVLTGNMIEIGRGGKNMSKISVTNPTGNKYIQFKQAVEKQKEETKKEAPKEKPKKK